MDTLEKMVRAYSNALMIENGFEREIGDVEWDLYWNSPESEPEKVRFSKVLEVLQ